MNPKMFVFYLMMITTSYTEGELDRPVNGKEWAQLLGGRSAKKQSVRYYKPGRFVHPNIKLYRAQIAEIRKRRDMGWKEEVKENITEEVERKVGEEAQDSIKDSPPGKQLIRNENNLILDTSADNFLQLDVLKDVSTIKDDFSPDSVPIDVLRYDYVEQDFTESITVDKEFFKSDVLVSNVKKDINSSDVLKDSLKFDARDFIASGALEKKEINKKVLKNKFGKHFLRSAYVAGSALDVDVNLKNQLAKNYQRDNKDEFFSEEFIKSNKKRGSKTRNNKRNETFAHPNIELFKAQIALLKKKRNMMLNYKEESDTIINKREKRGAEERIIVGTMDKLPVQKGEGVKETKVIINVRNEGNQLKQRKDDTGSDKAR